MFSVTVKPDIIQKFPQQITSWYGPFEINNIPSTIDHEINSLKIRCQRLYEGISLDEIPLINHWRTIFRTMGASPKYRSSVEGILKYYMEKKQLYSIHPIVDLYNWISITHLTPMACYDVEHLAGNVSLRYAQKGEPFVPLGNPKQTEKTKNGEVVYSDEEKVICRYWNYRDCDFTRITSDTHHYVFFADTTANKNSSSEDTSKSIAESLSRGLGVSVTRRTSC